MHEPVAASAQGDEILLGVVSEPTPRVNVVHLEIHQAPAALTAPAVPL